MSDTRATLLLRLRDHGDQAAWVEFHALYAPLLYHFARERGLSHADAEEIRDQCLLVVSQKIASLEYDRDRGRFKSWLRTIANGKIVDFLRKRREKRADTHMVRQIPDSRPTPEELWDQQWRYQHLVYCADQLRSEFNDRTFRVFELLAFEGRAVEEVCEQLGMPRDQVYTAKSRVLRRIRQHVEDLGLSL